jgi:hypothetical protein
MKRLPPFVVLAARARDFDSYEEAVSFARHNYPSVICERTRDADGRVVLRERARFDMLYDAAHAEWRVMLG